MKPKIACLANGPYKLADPMPALRRSGGEAIAATPGAALCRCGASRKKPFCDGTHRTNGFSDRRVSDGKLDRRERYAGRRITIHDNRAICAHAGFCTDSLQSVFRMGVEPWIDPDGAAAEDVIAAVRKCPSGALSYSIDGVEHRDEAREPAITVTDHGPYAVTGGVELAGAPFGDGASLEHYTLCRCGASKNKPFCDGSHWHVGFRDPA